MSQRKAFRRVLLLVLILILVLIGLRFFLKKAQNISSQDWTGDWKISYFYENEPDLVYYGELQLALQNSLVGAMEVIPPMSNKSEMLELANIQISNNTSIEGEVIHTQYKIQGGYLSENFEWKLVSKDKFQGKGKCIAFCAEGTEDKKITWVGIKAN